MAEVGAWLVRRGPDVRSDNLKIAVDHVSSDLRGIREGDGLLLVEEKSGSLDVAFFARIYRVRRGLDETALLLDGLLPVEPPRPSRDFGIQPPTVAVSRLEWPTFESALKTACGIDFPALPIIEGKTPEERNHIRDLLQWAVEDDLLGPADGPVEEIVGMSVRDRYLVGKLAPPDTRVPDDQVEDLPDAATANPEGDDREAEASTSNSLVPSSFGFTFCVDGSAKAVEVRASWGRYERTESERTTEDGKPIRCWKRI
ncbi:MAG: helicase, partial [Phyllobacteriaceae bacterium]|nr:helicase [Phyllobacteriaceae bacterium]